MEQEDIVASGWVATGDAAKAANYSAAHVRRLAIHGKVAARKVNRDWLINLDSLLAYQAQAGAGGRPRKAGGEQ